MKRDIFYSLVLIFFAVILSACGTDNKANPVAVSEYTFFNATTPIIVVEPNVFVESNETTGESNVTRTNDTYTISVQLLKHGLIQTGEIISMKPFDLRLGFVTDIITTTTTNGYAVFEYHAPFDYDLVKGQEVIIQAIFINPEDANTSSNSAPKITLTQDFLIRFD
ncbi:hypothetical protein MNB_SV-13-2074 [hydrothermal vent metagenome]|uniref:Lipoprotein n=1 Tax=hydrothermal vent metagenome TaxID=652676 RepID=A0A1W1BRK2_9ZZZZ